MHAAVALPASAALVGAAADGPVLVCMACCVICTMQEKIDRAGGEPLRKAKEKVASLRVSGSAVWCALRCML